MCCVTCAFVVYNRCCLLQQPSTDVKICMAPSCGNLFSLYQILDLDEPGQEMFACTKKCHGEICKVYKVSDDWKITWNHDGKEGDDNLNDSANLLIKWLTTDGNYSRFHDGKRGTGGSRKKDVCNQIADMPP